MKNCSFSFKKCLFGVVLFTSLMFNIYSLAQESVISTVTISKSKTNQNGYELNIDSTEPVDYKTVEYENGIYFDLKNSEISSDIGTIYDEVADIDNVTVKQLTKNKVRIYVQGKNAHNTDIVFTNSLFDTANQQKQIVINRPVNEYRNINSDLADDDTQSWEDNSISLSNILMALKDGSMGIVLICLTILFILGMIIKSLAKNISQEESIIGLNQSKQEYDPQMQSAFVTNNNNPIFNREENIKKAQEQLAQAHQKYQDYINKKYNTTSTLPKNINTDNLKKTIALSQYQKSTQNPYKNQEVIRLNRQNTTSLPQGNFQIPPRPKTQINTSKYIQRPNRSIVNQNMTQTKSSNMKFLESVSKIYERSGREDLADELKNSISRARQNV